MQGLTLASFHSNGPTIYGPLASSLMLLNTCILYLSNSFGGLY